MGIELFDGDHLIGIFKGFIESGLEFAAEIIAPYKAQTQLAPRSGQLLLVELENSDNALLGRITRFMPVGIMSGFEGDEYLAAMHKKYEPIPEQLKEDRLRYSVRVKLLGAIQISNEFNDALIYIPSVRKLPHLGSRVAYPSVSVLRHLCRLGSKEAIRNTELGFYALGEVIYNGGEQCGETFMKSENERIPVHFDINNLVGKRSFIFARAGYGKSNMMKFLLAELYRSQPEVKYGHTTRPVGTIVFDPEGEYFWPDQQGRPGLCDVPFLRDKLAVFTNRIQPNPYYGSWKVGGLKLDLRVINPSEIVTLCISERKHDDQNVIKIRTIGMRQWPALVNLLFAKGWNASDMEIENATEIDGLGAIQCSAMRNNLVPIIKTLHDPESNLISLVPKLVRSGKIVVIDLSLVSSAIGLQISGMLMNYIFNNNQASFTDVERCKLLPTNIVLEEAQSVLGKAAKEDSPFVQWVKEGRKYSLGAILVTQQPGSIMPELLSQGDNFFAFHLLSAHDLKTLQYHNAHFSDDVLAHLLNEPIRGNAFFWAAPYQPFVLPARIRSFEAEFASGIASGEKLTQAIDCGLGEFRSSHENMIERLRLEIEEAVFGNKWGVLAIEGEHGVFALFKAGLASKLASKLSNDEKKECCSDDQGKYLKEDIMTEALTATGRFGPKIQFFKGLRMRDNKLGQFIEIPAVNFDEGFQANDAVRRN